MTKFAVDFYVKNVVGEVDFLVDDYSTASVMPIEVKSGKNYTEHSALNRMLGAKDYGVEKAIVLHNSRQVEERGAILYLPIYYAMFIDSTGASSANMFF